MKFLASIISKALLALPLGFSAAAAAFASNECVANQFGTRRSISNEALAAVKVNTSADSIANPNSPTTADGKPQHFAWKGHQALQNANSENPTLGELSEFLLAGSDLVYVFASIRKAVLANEALEDGDPNKFDIQYPELILTQKHAHLVEENRNLHRYLKYEVTGLALQRFIDLNMDFVTTLPTDEVNTVEGDFTNINQMLKYFEKSNIGVREFDDQFSDRQLVYGITVNRTAKRITVFFRGSVQDSRDWPTNLNGFRKTIDSPTELQGHRLENNIKVHRGFYSYLNEKLDRKTGKALGPWDSFVDIFIPKTDIRTKFEEIELNLKYMLSRDEFSDYKVYISGHSLGGALAQLLAFQLAGNGALKDFKNASPITAVTYASPMVGNNGFREAYRILEDRDLLRHIRVSNAGDVVPVSIPGFGLYTQTGINIHTHRDAPMEVGRTTKGFSEEVNYAWKHRSGLFQFVGDVMDHHTPKQYYQNMFGPDGNQNMLINCGVEDLYREFNGPFSKTNIEQ